MKILLQLLKPHFMKKKKKSEKKINFLLAEFNRRRFLTISESQLDGNLKVDLSTKKVVEEVEEEQRRYYFPFHLIYLHLRVAAYFQTEHISNGIWKKVEDLYESLS